MNQYWQSHLTAPKDGTEILAYSTSGRMGVVYYNSQMQAWVVSGTERLVLGRVTHWRPLPSTPEGESRELQSCLLKRVGRMPTMEEFAAYGSWLKELLQSKQQHVTIAIENNEEVKPESGSLGEGPFWLWVPQQQIWIQINRRELDQIAVKHFVTLTSGD